MKKNGVRMDFYISGEMSLKEDFVQMSLSTQPRALSRSHNISGVFQQRNVSAFTWTTEVDGRWF